MHLKDHLKETYNKASLNNDILKKENIVIIFSLIKSSLSKDAL